MQHQDSRGTSTGTSLSELPVYIKTPFCLWQHCTWDTSSPRGAGVGATQDDKNMHSMDTNRSRHNESIAGITSLSTRAHDIVVNDPMIQRDLADPSDPMTQRDPVRFTGPRDPVKFNDPTRPGNPTRPMDPVLTQTSHNVMLID